MYKKIKGTLFNELIEYSYNMHCTEGNLRQMQNGCGNYENKFKKFKGERDEKKKELSCVMYFFSFLSIYMIVMYCKYTNDF